LKQIQLEPKSPDTRQLMAEACRSGNTDMLRELMQNGFKPVDQEDGGSSLMQPMSQWMGYILDFDTYREIRKKDIEERIRTLAIKSLISEFMKRVGELLESFTVDGARPESKNHFLN
jgi:uncharacterized protein (UPF0297 family)